MGCAHKENQDGFTLVEISIVMIIIGLLIGGTFGGMRLLNNMQINSVIQDLKALESAGITFKDTYGRLPGDIANPSVRLPNCTATPCSVGGNGDRRLSSTMWNTAISIADERFTIWHHLQAADLLAAKIKNVDDMTFGEGQPEAALGHGFRFIYYNGAMFVAGSRAHIGSGIFMGAVPSNALVAGEPFATYSCSDLLSIDNKIDDGLVYNGLVQSWYCGTNTITAPYQPQFTGSFFYDLKGY